MSGEWLTSNVRTSRPPSSAHNVTHYPSTLSSSEGQLFKGTVILGKITLLLLLALYREPKQAPGRRHLGLGGVRPFDLFPPQFLENTEWKS